LEDAAATDRERRREACLNMAAIWWWREVATHSHVLGVQF
jgi:hypothetical protein